MNRVDAKPVSNNCEGNVLINNLFERYLSCNKLKRKQGITWICKVHRELHVLRNGRYKVVNKITVHDMLDTERVVLTFVQRQVYTEEVCALKHG
mgnify:FL=1